MGGDRHLQTLNASYKSLVFIHTLYSIAWSYHSHVLICRKLTTASATCHQIYEFQQESVSDQIHISPDLGLKVIL